MSPLEALRGDCQAMKAIRAQVGQLLARWTGARRLPPVLILGETGTGKGLLARSLHEAGPRRDGPFVGVNCAAIPETLLEAELFGYERGAFTDARQAKPGLFRAAHGGTLFLDEIGLLPATTQGKLLTVIEERQVRRLGSTRTELVDVMVLAATSVDLRRAANEGRFRADLYHRLAVITLELPPLRERGPDILRLAEHFLARACADYALALRTLTPEATNFLATHRWPGNVRELANTMERVALLSESDEIPASLLGFLRDETAGIGEPSSDAAASKEATAGSLDDAVRVRVETVLRETGGNIRQTAAALGISRNTLRARMDRYGLRHHAVAPKSRRGPASPAQPGPTASSQWERRHLAFMQVRFLPSSTLDITDAFGPVKARIRNFGGRLEESSPTSLIAVFGLEPVDNAPLHAALAGLAIRNAVLRARATRGGAGDVVVALHCGDHLVGGQPPDLQISVESKRGSWIALERLVSVAPPGAIVLTAAVAPFLSRRFTLGPLPDLVGEASLLLGRADTPGAATRFVGRAFELEVLGRAHARVEEGHGQVVDVVGEAGLGKSRLVQEFVHGLRGWLALSTGGMAYGTTTPYLPFVDVVKRYCHIQDGDTPGEAHTKVLAALSPLAVPSGDVTTAILDLLGLLPPDNPFRRADPQHRRQRTIDAITTLVLFASDTQPVCLVVEDLHWVDFETRAVLDQLVNAIVTARLLLLVNHRPEYQHGWGGRSHYTQIRLDPLPRSDVNALLVDLLGCDPSVPALMERLDRRAEGNPFFLEESVRTLVETGVLIGERGAYRLDGTLSTIQVPETVQALLSARIDRLPPDAKALLQAAAVVGRHIPSSLLAAVAEMPTLQAHLAVLQGREFLYETRRALDVEYAFSHTLMQEVAYGSLPDDQRRALHGRIADSITRFHAGRLDEHTERLAHHTFQAHRWPEAFGHACAAAERAARRFANREAAAFFEQALAALAHLPGTRTTREQAVDLHLALRGVLVPLGENAQILRRLRAARDIAQDLGDKRRLGHALAGESNALSLIGDFPAAVNAGRRAQEALAGLGDVLLEAAASSYPGRALVALGRYGEAATLLAPVVASLSGDQVHEFRIPGVPVLPAVFARHWLAVALAEQGFFVEAARHAADGVAVAQAASDPRRPSPSAADTLVWAWLAVGDVALAHGLPQNAATAFQQTLVLCRTHDLPVYAPHAAMALAEAHAQEGRVDDATVAQFSPLLAEARRRRQVYSLARSLTRVVEAYLLAGREHDAWAAAGEALDIARRHGMRGVEAYALRIQAEALQRSGTSAWDLVFRTRSHVNGQTHAGGPS